MSILFREPVGYSTVFVKYADWDLVNREDAFNATRFASGFG
jgi:hypothetical protein